MADKKKVYWDSCIWLTLINQEEGRTDRCQYVIDQAHGGELEVWTSSLTLAEVFKRKCEGKNLVLAADHDLDFENFILSSFLFEAQVDHDTAVLARRLLRRHPELKKPTDAVHLATAVLNNLDEFHTFDEENLIPLDGKIIRQDGRPLSICKPPERPIAAQGSLALEDAQKPTADPEQ